MTVLRWPFAHTRVLTMRGSGGCGKTRLAVETRSAQPHTAGAACFLSGANHVKRLGMIATMQPEMRGHELEASFLDTYDRHSSTVLRYLRIAVGERDAEDLCSECFCSAWTAWARYRGDRSDTLPWLMRIARNRVIDRSRHLKAHPVDSLETHPNISSPGPVDPSDRLHLEAALSQMSKDDRELLALRAAGLTHAEIGQLQKRREEAVKTAWVRALGRIRPYLEVG